MTGGGNEGRREGKEEKGGDRRKNRSNRRRKIGDRKKRRTGDTGKGRKRKTTRKKEPQTNPEDPMPTPKCNPLETKAKMATAGESYDEARIHGTTNERKDLLNKK